MAERRQYRSALRSKRLIRQALLELLDEKEYERITVTDIVRRADLNRSTFYAHYPDVHGVVEEIQQEILARNVALIQELKYRSIIQEPMPYLQGISAMLRDNVELFRKLGHTETVHRHLDEFRRIIVEDMLKNEDLPARLRNSTAVSIRLHFFVGGIMNTYQQWAEGKLSCSLEEISREIATLIQKSCADYLIEE